MEEKGTRGKLFDSMLAPGWIGLFPRVSGRTFRFCVHASVDADARRGIEIAAAEADRMAQPLGASIEIAGSSMDVSGLAGIVIGADAGPLRPRVPAVSVAAEPITSCSSIFSVAPSAETRRAALNAWRATHPDDADGSLNLVEWHATLTAFGAAELNDRFTRLHHRPMSCAAWRGYFAVKALTETALRRATASDRCRALLDAELDGHKGARLSFDRATRILRQPLYVIRRADGREDVVGEVR